MRVVQSDSESMTMTALGSFLTTTVGVLDLREDLVGGGDTLDLPFREDEEVGILLLLFLEGGAGSESESDE